MSNSELGIDESLLSLSHLTPASDPDHPYSSWPSIPPNPIGRQVLLTPQVVARAAKEEIRTGHRIALDYPLYPSDRTLYGRMIAEHNIKRCDGGPATQDIAHGRRAAPGQDPVDRHKTDPYHPNFDDFLHFNTQSSTQWDYFLHFAYPDSGLFYGGLTAQEVQSESTGDIGIAAVAKAGGVQARALLVDIPVYRKQLGQPPMNPYLLPSEPTIDVQYLKDALKHFKLEPRVGDILILRTGFESAYNEDVKTKKEGGKPKLDGKWSGAQASEEMVNWIWQSGFVAVGSDNPTFEQWHPAYPEMLLHPILLSGQGIMIGEMMALNELSKECEKRSRWSFFLSSTPIMVEHGVASPPNAVAIF